MQTGIFWLSEISLFPSTVAVFWGYTMCWVYGGRKHSESLQINIKLYYRHQIFRSKYPLWWLLILWIFIKLGVVISECSQRVFPHNLQGTSGISKGQCQSGIAAWYQCSVTQSSLTSAGSKASLARCPSHGLTRSVPHKAEVRISVSHCKVSHRSVNTPSLPP